MKKRVKKLVLAKETVRSIEVEKTLNEVVGGSAETCTGAGSCRFCVPSGADVC